MNECVCGSAKVIAIEKLQTHDEVIDAIIEGFKGGTHWDQRKVVHTQTQSEAYPCGTQFCMLGAILTRFNLQASGIIIDIAEPLLEEHILSEWMGVFQCMSEDAAVDELCFLSTEQRRKLLSCLFPKSIRLH